MDLPPDRVSPREALSAPEPNVPPPGSTPKRTTRSPPGAEPDPPPAPAPDPLSGRWKSQLWALPVLLSAALGLSFGAARIRDAQRPVVYSCRELPLSTLDLVKSVQTVSAREEERLLEARALLLSDPRRAVAQLKEDQSSFGDQTFDQLLWQEREALLVHGLQCTGAPFEKQAKAFLGACPTSSFVPSVERDLATDSNGFGRKVPVLPARCPPLPVAPDAHPEASAEEAEVMEEVRARMSTHADDLPGRLEDAQQRFGRTAFAEERDALWLHTRLCFDRKRWRTEIEGRAQLFFERYPASRWRPVIDRELRVPPSRLARP